MRPEWEFKPKLIVLNDITPDDYDEICVSEQEDVEESASPEEKDTEDPTTAEEDVDELGGKVSKLDIDNLELEDIPTSDENNDKYC